MIQLSAKVVTIKRTNTKLIDVLGDVGGVMEVLWSLFDIISMFITDLLYDIDIVNNLFSFDLDKKQVLIKKLKKENNANSTNNILYENKETINGNKENIYDDNKNIYYPNIKSNKMVRLNIVNLNENDLNPTIENESEIELRNKRKKITKKMNTSTLRKNLQIKDEINNNKNKLIIRVLVGNKKDKEKERQVTYEQGKKFGKEKNFDIFEEIKCNLNEILDESSYLSYKDNNNNSNSKEKNDDKIEKIENKDKSFDDNDKDKDKDCVKQLFDRIGKEIYKQHLNNIRNRLNSSNYDYEASRSMLEVKEEKEKEKEKNSTSCCC